MNDSEFLPSADSAGWRIIQLKSTTSTNDHAWKLASEGAGHGLVIVAERQTGGRGRRGRTWLSPPGANLTFSLILRPFLLPEAVPPLSLVAAAALFSCLKTDIPHLAIKWPNDIYSGNRKLAGILSEMKMKGRETDFVLVGIGLNVNALPDDLPPALRETAVSMRQATGRQFQLSQVLHRFLLAFQPRYEQYCRHGLRGSLLEILRKHSYLSGRRVVVKVDGRTLVGTAREIDTHGRLLVDDESGSCWPVTAGEATIMKMDGSEQRGDAHGSGG